MTMKNCKKIVRGVLCSEVISLLIDRRSTLSVFYVQTTIRPHQSSAVRGVIVDHTVPSRQIVLDFPVRGWKHGMVRRASYTYGKIWPHPLLHRLPTGQNDELRFSVAVP
jgi:hypothetical protein